MQLITGEIYTIAACGGPPGNEIPSKTGVLSDSHILNTASGAYLYVASTDRASFTPGGFWYSKLAIEMGNGTVTAPASTSCRLILKY